MKYINGIGLRNVRVFGDKPYLFKLSPITILTGPNSSGKSTLTKAMMLFKDLDTKTWPYRTKLDSKNNTLGSFELIKSNNADDEALPSFYFRLFNTVLNENVLCVFRTSKSKKAHEMRIEEIGITNEKGETLFSFKTDDKDSFIFNINYEFFRNKIIKLLNSKEKHERIKDILNEASDANGEGVLCVDETVFQKWRDKAIGSGVNINEFRQLNTFLTYTKFNNVRDFDQNDFIFNYRCLNSILNLPKASLNTLSLKEHLLKTVQDQHVKEIIKKDEIDLDEILNVLLLSQYKKFEEEQLHEVSNFYRNIDKSLLDFYSDNSDAVASFFSFDFGHISFHPFYDAISEISTEYKKLEIGINVPDGRNAPNFKKVQAFSSIVYEDIIVSLKSDVCDMFSLSLGNIKPERIVGYDNPWHNLIELNKNQGNTEFIKKWFKEFNVCDDINFETPVAGLGYTVKLVKNGQKVSLFDEGMGTNHILNIILWLSNLSLSTDSYEYDEYHWLESKFIPRTILIEEPEANLHPAWQSKLAELFVDAMDTLGLTFIIETHSEYLVRKLQYLVAKKNLESDKVQIIYIDSPDSKQRYPGAKQMFSIKIDKSGILSREFGPGFFDEADNLALQLLSLQKSQNN